MTKGSIFYHRAYRKIPIAGKYIIFESLFLIFPLLIAVLFLYPEITLLMNRFASAVLTSSIPSADIKMLEKPYILSEVRILSIPGKYPSPLLSLLLFLFSLSSILLLPKTRISRPIAAWIIFVSSINLLSALFFILEPFMFPYNIMDFSEFYVKTEVSIWLFVPIVMAMTLLPLPSNIFSKFFITTITLLYSITFGIMRYTFFLYILREFSYIFMPVLFFSFGPLMDFTYIVGIYSLYCSIIAKKRNNRIETGFWKWS